MKFSIITINYNNVEGLRNTVKSVVNQTYTDYEFIIIDGGSTDGSVEVIKEYANKITYWVSEPDKGIYNAMNKGIEVANGEYLNFMNSGDCFYNNDVLQKVADYHLEKDMIVGHDYHYNEDLKLGHVSLEPMRLSMITFYEETLAHQSTFFKKCLFQEYQYDESYKFVSDWIFYLRKIVAEEKTVIFIPDIICKREAGGITERQNAKSQEEKRQYLKIFLAPGVYKDYASLSKIDKTTLYKFFSLCNEEKNVKMIRFCIKVIYRISKFFK